ncbi:hypothetical protein BJ742DRAFT_404167 [Cladochytrium replicatum]|nr:hypothetical protein BJ742DRAFT_404167 [Cladochytrium replicatum]
MAASGSQTFLRSGFCRGYLVRLRASGQTSHQAPEMLAAPQSTFGNSVSAPFNVFRGISNQVSNDVEMQGIRPPTVTSLLETWVKECIPNCEVLLMEAEKLDIHVPMSSSHHLRPLLRALENDNTETVEWTISSMALQEVFAKFIAGKAKFMAPDNLASFSSQQSSTQIAICSVCQQTFEPLPNMGSRVTCSRCSALEASKRDSKLPPYIDFAQFCLLHGSVVVRRQASAEIANQPPIPRRKRSLVGALLPVLIANQRLQMCLTITICTLLLPMVLLFGFLSNNPERPLLSTLTDCKGFIIESKYRITCDPKDLTAAMFQTAVAPQNFSKATKLGACTAKNPASCYPITFSGLPSDSALFSVITERGVQPYGIQPDDTQYLYRGFIRQPDTSMEFIRRVLNAAVPRLRFWYSDPSLGPRFEEFASPTLFLFNETVNFGDTIPSLLAGGATNADEYGDGLLRTVESYPALFSRVDDVASVFSTRQNEVNSTSLTLPAECSAQYGQTGLVGFAASNFSDVASKFRDIFPTFGITFTSLPTRGSVNPPSFTFHSYGIKQSSPARLYLSASPETSVGQAFLVGPPFYTQFRYSNLTTYGLPVRCLEFSKNLPTEYYEANSALQVTISSMTNQWLRSLSNATSAPLVRGQSFKLPPISRVSRPYTAWIGLEFFSLLITALMLPRMVDLIVQDKSKGAYELMRMQTGTIIHYWIGNYIYGFWATYGLCSLMTGCVILTRSELYAMVGVLEMLGIMLVWAHCVVGLSFLLSGIFQRPVTAAIASCFAVAIISLVPFMAPNTQINGIPEGGLPMLYLLFPPFGIVSLTRSLYSSFTRGNIMGFVVTQTLFTFVVGTLYGFLGIYLQFIRRTSGGFGLDPMLGLHATKNKGVTLEDGATYELTYGENIRNEENAIMGSLQNQTSDQALTCVRLRGKDVRNVSFRISSGEVFGLLGPSGGGKSTILKMVSGLLRPPQGEIYFNGRSLKEILSRGDLGKYVGICPQKSLLWPDITVQRHLMVFAQMRGYPANQSLTKYAHHIARSVGLEASLKVAAKFLSVGAQRLLGIGIAITGDPTLVILDEPTLGLDPATRQYIWKVIEMLKLSPTSTGQPRSILIATSAQDEAEMLCDKVMVLSKGSANGYGSPSQLRHRFGDTLQLSLLYSVDALLTISAQPTRAEEAESITTMKTAEHVRIDMVLQKIRDVVSPTAYVESTIPTDFHAVFASFQRGQEPGTLPPVRVFWTVRTALAVARERDLGAMFVHLESAAQSLSVQSWELKPRSFNDASVKLSGV